MALELPSLLQRYHLDSSGAVAGAKTGVGALGSLRGAFSSLKGVIGLTGIAVGGLKIGQFLKESVSEASATQQSVKSVTALFGKSAEEIIKWGETNATAFGISKGSALAYAEQLGGVLKGFGFMPKAAADMSLSLEKVAGDLAIFKHQDPSQVVSTFQRALYGSSRGLKQYGIDTSNVAVQQAALSLGIKTATKTWDAQTKAQVYYALIMRGTTAQVGTAAKRSHDLAIEQKVLSAEMSNLRDKIGTVLLPILAAFVGLITRDVLPGLIAFSSRLIAVGKAIGDKFGAPIKRAFLLVRLAVAEFIAGIKNPGASLDAFGWVGRSIIGAGQIVRRAVNDILTAVHAFTAGVSGDTTKFAPAWVKAFNRIGLVVHTVVEDIKKVWHQVGPILQPVFDAIGHFLGTSAGKSAAAAAGFTVLGISLATIVGSPILTGLAALANVMGFVLDAIISIDLATAGWVLAVGLMVGAIVYFYKHSRAFRDEVHHVVEIFQKEWIPAIKNAAIVVRDYLGHALNVAVASFQNALPSIRAFGLGLLHGFERVIPPVLRFVGAIARDVLPTLRVIAGFVSRNVVPILAGLGIVLAAIATPAILGAIGSLVGVFGGLALSVAGVFTPMNLTIAALGLLAAGAVYAYTHFKGFHDVVNSVASRALAFGKLLARDLLPALRAIAGFVERNIIPILATFTAVLAGIGASYALDALGTGFAIVATAVTELLSPVALAVAGIALLGAAAGYAYTHFKGFHDAVNFIVGAVIAFGEAVARNLLPILQNVAGFIGRNVVPILVTLGGIIAGIAASSAIPAIGAALTAAFGGAGVAAAAAAAPIIGLGIVFGGVAAAAVLAYTHFKGFHDAVDNLATKIGPFASALAKDLAPVLKAIGNFIGNNIVPVLAAFGTALAIITVPAGLALLPPLLTAIGVAIGAILSPAVLTVVAIAALVGGLVYAYQHFKAFRDVVNDTMKAIAGVVVPLLKELAKTFVNVIGQIVEFVRGHWAEIHTIIQGVMIAISVIVVSVLKIIHFAWNTVGKQVLAVVRATFGVIGGVIRGAMEVILGVIGLVLDLLTFHWSKAWHDLGHIVHGVFEIVASVLKGALKVIGNLLVAGGRVLAALFGLAWKGLVAVAKAALNGVVEVLRNLPKLILIAVAGLPFILFKVGRVIVEGLIHGIEAVAPSVGRWFTRLPGIILNALKTAGSALLPVGKSIIGGIVTGLEVAAAAMFLWFAGLPLLIVRYLPGAAKWLFEVGKLAIGGLLVGAKIAWHTMLDWVGKLGDALIKLFKNAPKWLLAAGKAIITGLWTGAKLAFTLELAWLRLIERTVVTVFKNAPHWLLSAGRAIIDGLLNGAKAAWHLWQGWIVRIEGAVIAVFKAAPHWLLSAGRSIITGLWSGARAVWTTTLAWFKGLAHLVIGALVNATKWLYQKGIDIMIGLWNGVQETFVNVLAWFRALPGNIISAITSVAGSALDWLSKTGADIMQGLWNGLIAIWKKISGWFSDVVSHIPKIFRKFLGLASPSKVMRTIGEQIMEGLRLGLVAGGDGVLAGIDRMTRVVGGKLKSMADVPINVVGTFSASAPTHQASRNVNLTPRDLNPNVGFEAAGVARLVATLQATLANIGKQAPTPFRAFVTNFVEAKALNSVASAIERAGFVLAGYKHPTPPPTAKPAPVEHKLTLHLPQVPPPVFRVPAPAKPPPLQFRVPFDPIKERLPLSIHPIANPIHAPTALRLASDLAMATHALGHDAAGQMVDQSQSWNIEHLEVVPKEHVLTERGLTSEMRRLERHGTLQARTGLPRKAR